MHAQAPARPSPPDAGLTSRRATTVEADRTDSPPPSTEPVRPRSTLPWILGAAAVVVAVVVLALTGVFSGGSGGSGGGHRAVGTVGPSASSQNALLPGDNLPPGTPKITAVAAHGAVVFRWTYSASLATDTYVWRRAGAATQSALTKPTVTVPDPGRSKVCIEVKVVRADGSNGSVTWSPEGCGTA